jgi:hypothetical protein
MATWIIDYLVYITSHKAVWAILRIDSSQANLLKNRSLPGGSLFKSTAVQCKARDFTESCTSVEVTITIVMTY